MNQIINEVRRNANNQRFYKKNFNPWNFQVNDCVIRSFAAAILMKYEFLVEYAKDSDNTSYWDMSKTCKFINGMDENDLMEKPEIREFFENKTDLTTHASVNQFIDDMQSNNQLGIYVCVVGESFPNHVVCCTIKKTGSYFTDTFDSGDLRVFYYFKVVKQVPKGDPRRLDIRAFFKPDKWKERFREVFFELAAEWENAESGSQKTDVKERMEFLLGGELYDFGDSDKINIHDITGEDIMRKSNEMTK